MSDFPENAVDMVNGVLGGFNIAIGLRFIKAKAEEFVAELTVGDQHLQPYGLVHGGIYAGMIETVCSTGAAIHVFSEGKNAVGLENATSFLKAVRSGTLRCSAKPVLLGRRSHVWDAQIHDDRNRLVATGRVRLMILESGAEADGMTVALKA
jgi:1,4-dihydroxy-2-naphthoyl-CoA hydrolase